MPEDVGPGRLCGNRHELGTYAVPDFTIWSFCFHRLPTNCTALAQQVGLASLLGSGGCGPLPRRQAGRTLLMSRSGRSVLMSFTADSDTFLQGISRCFVSRHTVSSRISLTLRFPRLPALNVDMSRGTLTAPATVPRFHYSASKAFVSRQPGWRSCEDLCAAQHPHNCGDSAKMFWM